VSQSQRFHAAQLEWLAARFQALTVNLNIVRPSVWAEERRYLPPSVSPMPGFYSFAVTPYLREIVDCLSIDSPVREVALMKGVQVGATSGLLENALGYYIDHVGTAPMMMVTADDELAQLRIESHITPMLQHSGLLHLIQSTDESNPRKTGRTVKKMEWVGGGFLIPFGAKSAPKLRSTPIQVLLNDEVDAWPDTVGKDGDPVQLARGRTKAFESSRKILDISTPLLRGKSKIEAQFKRGDQRQYFVKCLRCEHPQVLRWSHTDNATGEITGIRWETENGRLVVDSVRYHCQACGHPHSDHDKTRLFADGNGEWKPTAVPVAPDIRSYHLSALYSPPGMQSWAACVQQWLEAWDVEKNQARDLAKLQVFYNNVLGESYEHRGGQKIKFGTVSAHRRGYSSGQIPNKFAAQYCGGTVQLLTCSVDVHADCLPVAVWGWTPDKRAVLIEYHRFYGVTERLDDPDTWGRLAELIESKEYVADDGRKYRIQLTLIDSGFQTDQVYDFCSQYARSVHPIKGLASLRSARKTEFTPFTTRHGTEAFGITVDFYKDRWSSSLRREWDGISQQPGGHFNAPLDITDAQLKELTVETKSPKVDRQSGEIIAYEWHRPQGAANELWDLLVYGSAALDLIVWSLSRESDLEYTDWRGFWEACEAQKLYFTPA
jgi:phage terminase large subunit GpA-like protein